MKREIIVYKDEMVDGVARVVKTQNSIAYTSLLRKWTPTKQDIEKISASFYKTHASVSDEDLYYTKSILVSSNWNKNNDIFDKYQVWAARHTPMHKPTNLEHDEKQLVGHITDNWAVSTDGRLIADNTIPSDLPDLFHIVNGAVIYTNWTDLDLIKRTQKLVHEIEAGRKFVSMECLFTDFGYAIISPEGAYSTLDRDEDTAFLTKHLTAYGGTGFYKGHKIGRLLKNITFCGKGYVDTPANVNSIIFNDKTTFNFTQATRKNPFYNNSGVYAYKQVASDKNYDKENLMSVEKEELFQDTVADLQAEKKALEDKLGEAKRMLSEAGIQKYEDKIKELQVQLEAANKKFEQYEEERREARNKISSLGSDLKLITDDKKQIEGELNELREAQLKAKRTALLVDGGVDREIATQKVDIYANLTDEQFQDVADDVIRAAQQNRPSEDDDVDGADVNANTRALDDVKVSHEATLAAAGHRSSDMSQVRTDLRNLVSEMLKK